MDIVLEKAVKGYGLMLRKPHVEDAVHLAEYWFGPHSQHLKDSINFSVMGNKDDYYQRMRHAIAKMPEAGPWTMLSGDVEGKPAGCVLINQVENHRALVHVHIWDPAHRRLGFASHLALDAFRYFLESFSLEKLVMQIPVENKAVIELLHALGLESEGQFFGKAAPICMEGYFEKYSIGRDTLPGLQSGSNVTRM